MADFSKVRERIAELLPDNKVRLISPLRVRGSFRECIDAVNDLKCDTLTKITYNELKKLRDEGKLVGGASYRIIDYECTTAQENTISAGHRFDIIVTADDERTLNESARACRSEVDLTEPNASIFINDGDLCFWEGEKVRVRDANGDEREMWFWKQNEGENHWNGWFTELPFNECVREDSEIHCGWVIWCDAYSIDGDVIVVRDNLFDKVLDGVSSSNFDLYFDKSNLSSWELKYSLDNDSERFAWADESGKGVIYYMKDEWNNECPYDFKNIMFKRKLIDGKYSPISGRDTWVYTFNGWDMDSEYCYDATTDIHNISEETRRAAIEDGDSAPDGDMCYGNKIREYRLIEESFDYQHRILVLNNNVFLGIFYDNGYGDGWEICEFYSNTQKEDCNNNTFGNRCYCNTFDNHCFSNTFGDSCSSNTFGNNCRFNTLARSCGGNTFGDGCNNNTLDIGCSSNTFERECYENSVGMYCSNNIIGDACYSNTTYSYCNNNTLKAGCRTITLEAYSSSNIFGDNCSAITFGRNCVHNTFGKGCSSITFGDNCTSNNFGWSCKNNSLGNNCYSNSFEDSCSYNMLGQFCNENIFGNKCNSNTFGDSCSAKHLEYTSSKTSGISGSTPEFWFNGAKIV